MNKMHIFTLIYILLIFFYQIRALIVLKLISIATTVSFADLFLSILLKIFFTDTSDCRC